MALKKQNTYKSFIVVRCTIKNINDERITKVNTSKNIIKIYSGKWISCMQTANEYFEKYLDYMNFILIGKGKWGKKLYKNLLNIGKVKGVVTSKK